MRFPLLATAALSMLALAAKPAAATTIDFNTLAGSNGTPLTSYREGGYTVAATSGDVSVATNYGNPAPNLFFDFDYDPTGSGAVSVSGQDPFNFISADLSSGSSLASQFSTYTIAGFLNSQPVFTQSGTIFGSPTNAFVTVAATQAGVSIDQLYITESGGGSSLSANLDNIVVQAAAVPEPSSLAVLGIALIGGFVACRRRPTEAR